MVDSPAPTEPAPSGAAETRVPFTRPATVVDAFRRLATETRYGYTLLDNTLKPTRYSYQELWKAAEARGRALLGMGLKRGDRVAMILSQPEDFVITFHGALVAGLVPVPMYPPLAFGKLDAYTESAVNILTAAGASLIISDKMLANILWQVVPRVKSVRDLITVEKLPGAALYEGDLPGVGPEDLAFLQFTSGSTAAPKGVMVTHGNLIANTWAIAHEGLKLDRARDVGISWLPLYHDMGLIGFVIVPLMEGMDIVILPTLAFVRKPNIWMQAMHDYKGTVSFGPNFAFALASKRAGEKEKSTWDLSRVRSIGCGAEPIHPQVIRDFVDTFAACGLRSDVVMPAYGMAEATLAMTFAGLSRPLGTLDADPEQFRAAREVAPPPDEGPPLTFVSCGQPFEGHSVAIMDADDNLLPEDVEGEIVFAGPSVTTGYWQNPEATAESFRGGWLHTGDLGFLHDGAVYITGRSKDLIILHGRNHHPQTIEWAVQDVEGVRRGNVVAFSRPGTESEELVIVVEAKPDAPAGLADRIKAAVAEAVSLKVVDVVALEPGQLPKTSSGKLQRRKTRDQYIAGVLGGDGVRTLGSTGEKLTVARHVAKSWLGRATHVAGKVFNSNAPKE